jgi:enoyl-CoA hydratase/carnithine racemase
MLDISSKGSALCISLDRPDKGNSLSSAMTEALTQAIQDAGREGVATVILQGRGRHFCTGFDLSDIDRESDDTLLARFVRIELLLQAIHAAPFQTVAIAQGRVMGAGADIFAACQRRYLVEGAALAFPGAGFGLVLGTGRLARCVGAAKAREWVSTGRLVQSDEALASGIAQRVLRPDEVEMELERVGDESPRLDEDTRRAVLAASGGPSGAHERDLYRLVLSAARPGIKARIQDYRMRARR